MQGDGNLERDFGVRTSKEEFEERFLGLHKQLFATSDPSFGDVTSHVFAPQPGMYQVDHSIVHDGTDWHVFYLTGDMRNSEEWISRFSAGDMEGANEACLEPGNAHAAGRTLFDLEFKGNVFFPPQGRFDLASRGCCAVFRHQNRWGMLYDVRGEGFIGMSLAWSDDLYSWEIDPDNPYLKAASWASAAGECKDPHVVSVDGVYLIYYVVMDSENYCTIALASTTDWRSFRDEGWVFRSAPMLRGTMGVESPCVVQRDGMWHLFFTYGPGTWHSVSRSPRDFVCTRGGSWNVGTGFYYFGPFHAAEIVQHDGDWWMTTDRKEETRRQNRLAGRLCYRGTYEDEKTLEEGIYLSHIRWQGDQPILEMPERK